jgi:hypothetical protein
MMERLSLIVSSQSKDAIIAENGGILQPMTPSIHLGEGARVRVERVIIFNAVAQPLAVLCDFAVPCLLNSGTLQSLAVFQCTGGKKGFEAVGPFQWVPIIPKQLSSVQLRLWNLNKGEPAISQKGHPIRSIYHLTIERASS